MLRAILPMYDFPELRAATDAWWARLARALRREGLKDVPSELTRNGSVQAAGEKPELILTQICGYHLAQPHCDLTYIATPCYTADGCSGPLYRSHIVVPESAPARSLEELRGLRCAISSYTSHSGCNALRGAISPLARDGRFFSEVLVSGAHACSLDLLRSGEADVAAVDCITYALLARHRPNALEGTRIIGQTEAAPACPYVAQVNATSDVISRLRGSLRAAAEDPALANARSELLLIGFQVLDAHEYDQIGRVEEEAKRRGFRDF
jgi:ABC-type phosphate/phosphonate transport system substrate-binding protein